MQVLKESKVKFVSAIGVCLLTSLWLSHSSRSYCRTLGGAGKPSTDFKPANLVLQVFPDPAGRGGLGSIIFPFLWFQEDGGLVWTTVMTGAQFPVHALRDCAVCTHHSVHLYQAGADNLPHFVTLDQSVRHP